VDIVRFIIVALSPLAAGGAGGGGGGGGGAARSLGGPKGYIPIVRRVRVFSSMVLEAKLAAVGSSVLSRSYRACKQKLAS